MSPGASICLRIIEYLVARIDAPSSWLVEREAPIGDTPSFEHRAEYY